MNGLTSLGNFTGKALKRNGVGCGTGSGCGGGGDEVKVEFVIAEVNGEERQVKVLHPIDDDPYTMNAKLNEKTKPRSYVHTEFDLYQIELDSGSVVFATNLRQVKS